MHNFTRVRLEFRTTPFHQNNKKHQAVNENQQCSLLWELCPNSSEIFQEADCFSPQGRKRSANFCGEREEREPP